MRTSCGLKPLATEANTPAAAAAEVQPTALQPDVVPELDRTASTASTLARGDSVASVATSAGDYQPAFDDGVDPFDDGDL
jgi:hypothetical protein